MRVEQKASIFARWYRKPAGGLDGASIRAYKMKRVKLLELTYGTVIDGQQAWLVSPAPSPLFEHNTTLYGSESRSVLETSRAQFRF